MLPQLDLNFPSGDNAEGDVDLYAIEEAFRMYAMRGLVGMSQDGIAEGISNAITDCVTRFRVQQKQQVHHLASKTSTTQHKALSDKQLVAAAGYASPVVGQASREVGHVSRGAVWGRLLRMLSEHRVCRFAAETDHLGVAYADATVLLEPPPTMPTRPCALMDSSRRNCAERPHLA